MKKQHIILVVLLSVVVLASCDKYLGGLTSSNLAGTWDITKVTQKTYTNGTLDSTSVQTNVGSITFNAGGDGNYSATNEGETQSGSFDWFEKNDKVFLNMLNLSDSIMTENLAIGFDVKSNTATDQVWSLTYSSYSDEEGPTGASVTYLKKMYIEIELEKQ